MLKIGITGSLGTGKSTVAALFEKRGAVVIDADEIAHSAMIPYSAVWKKIVTVFGKGILNDDLTINRKKLAGIVFQREDSVALQRLNAIVHPAIIKQIRKRVKKLEAEKSAGVAVIDAPLLIEVGLNTLVDKLIVVTAGIEVQQERLRSQRGMMEEEVKRRIASQMDLKKKIRQADFMVDNNGTVENTERQVDVIWEKIRH